MNDAAINEASTAGHPEALVVGCSKNSDGSANNTTTTSNAEGVTAAVAGHATDDVDGSGGSGGSSAIHHSTLDLRESSGGPDDIDATAAEGTFNANTTSMYGTPSM